MKILYIDYNSSRGHVQFNRIQLNALTQIAKVYTIFKEGYFDNIQCPKAFKYFDIPLSQYKNESGMIMSRLWEYRLLIYIKNKINPKEWDYIIFSAYDIVSMFFARFFSKAMVFEHSSIEALDRPLKKIFFKGPNNKFTHIVFNESMKQKLSSSGIKKTVLVPHGFLPMEKDYESTNIMKELCLCGKYIFLPSLSSVDKTEIELLINNPRLIQTLEHNNIKLVVKGDYISISPNVVVYNGFFSENEYKDLFLNATFVFLPYSKSFKYRVSGVFFECIANNKYCVYRNIPALNIYDEYIKYPHHSYESIDDLVQCIKYMSNVVEVNEKYSNVKCLENPLLAWREILK